MSSRIKRLDSKQGRLDVQPTVAESLRAAQRATSSREITNAPAEAAGIGRESDMQESSQDGRDSNTSPEALAIDKERVEKLEARKREADKAHPGEHPLAKLRRVFGA